jgi:hypothetical protein
MHLSAVFGFDDAPSANRFLNDVNSNPSLGHAKAKLFDRDKVRITYSIQSNAFDDTMSLLDDLSSHYDGKEIEM